MGEFVTKVVIHILVVESIRDHQLIYLQKVMVIFFKEIRKV